MSGEFDEEELLEMIQDAVENAMADAVDEIMATVEDSVEASVQNAIQNMLSDFEFILPNGVQVSSRKKLSVTSSDKTKVLVCYGGLRVDGVSLFIQTRVDCWEEIGTYPTKEEAVQALEKVKNAIKNGLDFLDL